MSSHLAVAVNSNSNKWDGGVSIYKNLLVLMRNDSIYYYNGVRDTALLLAVASQEWLTVLLF